MSDIVDIRELDTQLLLPESPSWPEIGHALCQAAGCKLADIDQAAKKAALYDRDAKLWPSGLQDAEELPGKIAAVLEICLPGSIIEVIELESLAFYRFEREENGYSVRRWSPHDLGEPIPYGAPGAPEWYTFL